MTRTLESKLEERFRRLVRSRLGGRVYKFAPLDKGAPDRVVLLPGGRRELVELKREGETLSPAQRVWHGKAEALGTVVPVLAGEAEIEAWIAEQELL